MLWQLVSNVLFRPARSLSEPLDSVIQPDVHNDEALADHSHGEALGETRNHAREGRRTRFDSNRSRTSYRSRLDSHLEETSGDVAAEETPTGEPLAASVAVANSEDISQHNSLKFNV